MLKRSLIECSLHMYWLKNTKTIYYHAIKFDLDVCQGFFSPFWEHDLTPKIGQFSGCFIQNWGKAHIIWAAARENLSLGFANNTGADQPAHPCSLISPFVICFLESIICKLATGEILAILCS